MCGLVGVAGSIEDQDRSVFHNLLWIDAIRGNDGTGVASVDLDDPESVFVVKVSGGPEHLFDRNAYVEAISKNKSLLLGHNRKRTKGDSSWVNAHPFDFENIVGAHNGFISEFSRRKMSHIPDTDSEQFFDYLNDHGIEESMKELDKGPADAYCFVWYDKRAHTINFIRNNQRPLYYCFNKKRTVLYWASEIAFLYTALNHNHVEFIGKDVTGLSEDAHMSWEIPQKPGQVFGKATRVQRKPVGFFQSTGKPKDGHFPRGAQSSSTSSSATSTVLYAPGYGPDDNVIRITPRTLLSPEEYARTGTGDLKQASLAIDAHRPKYVPVMSRPIASSLKDKPPYYIGYNAEDMYSKETFDKKMGDGCTNCTSQPAWGEPVKFLKDGAFLCAPCVIENKDSCLEVCREFL